MEYELYHHGILGMHWGIRRYQNKDGTWTEAGKRRYGSGNGDKQNNNAQVVKSKSSTINKADKKVKKAENAYKVASAKYELNPNSKNRHSMDLAAKELDWAKQDRSDERIKQKLKQESTKKSQHRLKLEAKYREKGMTQEEAEIAAYKRVKTEKILAVTAGLTVAAAVAYAGYKHYDKVADKVINSGTLLQNISTNSNKGVEDAFYAAYKKPDMLKYRGLYGDQLRKQGSKDIFKTTISVNSNIKVASNENAKRVLADLVKSDPEYAKLLGEHLDHWGSTGRYPEVQEASDLLKKGIINDKVWEETNHLLVDHSERGAKVSSALYQKLKEAGYDAILDTNDMKYSGYNTKRPVVIFNGASKLSAVASQKLSDTEVSSDYQKAMRRLLNQEAVRSSTKDTAGYVALGAASVGISKALDKRSENQIVQQYRKEHPNTKLSYTEILRMQERKKISGEN